MKPFSKSFILPGGKGSLRFWYKVKMWRFGKYLANNGEKTIYELGPITVILDN